jgi:MoxR-like ATPase
VVLVGQPGTGKTKFAQLLADALRGILGQLQSSWVSVRPDFDETELIGYERIDGKPELRDFALRILKSEEPLSPHLLVLEEFNLALLERYLASVLSATQDPERRVPLPGDEQARLPVDTLILATCNSYLDEPESRTRISAPSKRRATVITMPNVLAEHYEAQGDGVIVSLAVEMIGQERARVEARGRQGLGTSLDPARLRGLSSVGRAEDLSQEARTELTAIVKSLLSTSEGREFCTLGLLRDIALALALGERNRDGELTTLGEQVTDKIVHQMRGPTARADSLAAATRNLPNHADIVRLLDRMRGPGNELVSLV